MFLYYPHRKYESATNDIFAQNAWYFRNALVRANYNNLKENIHETTLYLEKFIRNLLLNESNELKNRYLHIQNNFEEKETENVGANSENVGVNVGVKLNKTQKKIVDLIRNNPSITIEEMAKFASVETRTIERNIKTLKQKEIIERVGADKNGHWLTKI